MCRYMKTAMRCLCLALAAIIAASISCDENPAGNEDDVTRLRLHIYSGNNQSERVGATLPEPLVVQVRNILGTPQPGIEVLFTVLAGGGSVSPAAATSDGDGLASCSFSLGTLVGKQLVRAVAVSEDSMIISATGVAISCDEERPSKVCEWPADRVYVTTTSSSLISGTGSVLLEYDTGTGTVTKLRDSGDIIQDLSFSSRGELFVTTARTIEKVDPLTYELDDFLSYAADIDAELEPNAGGILAGVSTAGPFVVRCPPAGVASLTLPAPFQYIRYECLAAHPVTRDLFVVTGSGPPTFQLWRIAWDGRSDEAVTVLHATITGGAAEPRGMCIDSTGTIYLVLEGNDTFRRIVSVSADGSVDTGFFDFYDWAGNSQEAGRWGDIAYASGKLYLIDTRNDRFVTITTGAAPVLTYVEDDRFSKRGSENERYGIAVRPAWLCAGEQ
jgi:hypothetical protein